MITPVDVALSQIGVAEATGQNDGIPSKRYQLNPFWTHGRPVSHRYREVPWCQLFASYCYRNSDWGPLEKTEPEWWSWSRVANFVGDMDERGLFIPAGTNRLPRYGDILIINNRGLSDAGKPPPPGQLGDAHCGLVHQVLGGLVRSVDGNWGNKVDKVERELYGDEIYGWVRPYSKALAVH